MQRQTSEFPSLFSYQFPNITRVSSKALSVFLRHGPGVSASVARRANGYSRTNVFLLNRPLTKSDLSKLPAAKSLTFTLGQNGFYERSHQHSGLIAQSLRPTAAPACGMD
jgi:hypothetical protein